MEKNRKYLGKEKTNFVQFQFKIHTQDCNGKCICYWLLKKKEEKHLPRDTEKADSQAPGRTSGMRIPGILYFEHVPLRISADSKLWSLSSENH